MFDGGAHPPLAIIVLTNENDDSFLATANAVLDTMVIGDTQPHPVRPEDRAFLSP